MIVSHSLRCIFLKPFKVGGTSVLQALGMNCRDGDLVSAVFLDPEDLQRFPTSQLTPLAQHRCPDRPRATRYQINTSLNTHALPRMIQDDIGWETWSRLFKFTIVRNPWDLMVSFRRMPLLNPHGYQKPPAENFPTFCRSRDATGARAAVGDLGAQAEALTLAAARVSRRPTDPEPLQPSRRSFLTRSSDCAALRRRHE